MSHAIQKLTIEGFKSIRKLEDFPLRRLNVLIGANGAGKSNFVTFFRMLRELIDQRLQLAVQVEGGADSCLYLGPKITRRIFAKLEFGKNGYEFELVPTADGRLVFANEVVYLRDRYQQKLGSGHLEAKLRNHKDDAGRTGSLIFASAQGHPSHTPGYGMLCDWQPRSSMTSNCGRYMTIRT